MECVTLDPCREGDKLFGSSSRSLKINGISLELIDLDMSDE